MLESEFENGKLRIDDKDLKRFYLQRDGEVYAFINMYKGVIVTAGYSNQIGNHHYSDSNPNWDRVVEVLRTFREVDSIQFLEIEKSLNRKTREWKKLRESAVKYLSNKVDYLSDQLLCYKLLLAELQG